MSKLHRSINISYGICLVLGLIIGWELSTFKSFQGFKLLNLFGISYDLIGVLLLTYVVLAKDGIQDFIATHVAINLVIFSGAFPVAMIAGAGIGWVLGAESGKEVLIFSSIYLTVSTLPITYIFGSPIFEPVGDEKYSPEERIKWIGAAFLILGFVFQIIATVMDILSDS